MANTEDVATLSRLFAEEHVWGELLKDRAFWERVSQLPKDEQAEACVARIQQLGIEDSDLVMRLRIEQMALMASLVDELGLDTALRRLRPKEH